MMEAQTKEMWRDFGASVCRIGDEISETEHAVIMKKIHIMRQNKNADLSEAHLEEILTEFWRLSLLFATTLSQTRLTCILQEFNGLLSAVAWRFDIQAVDEDSLRSDGMLSESDVDLSCTNLNADHDPYAIFTVKGLSNETLSKLASERYDDSEYEEIMQELNDEESTENDDEVDGEDDVTKGFDKMFAQPEKLLQALDCYKGFVGHSKGMANLEEWLEVTKSPKRRSGCDDHNVNG